MMRIVTNVVMVAIGSMVGGWIIGLFWILGNRVSEGGLILIVPIALVTNMVTAAIFYYLLRGTVHQAEGGLGLLLLLMPINVLISLGIAASVAGAIGAGTTVKMGAHFFSWGLSFAYGKAIHDVRHGTWLHD